MKTIEKSYVQDCFAKILLAYRQEHNLSQSKLARKMNITDRSFIGLEHGDFCPSAVSLVAFMQLLSEDELHIFLDALMGR